jgi:Mn-dependent DtxR family transcriptional regulator
VEFTEIQEHVFEKVRCEGRVDPLALARLMQFAPDDVQAAADDLVNRDLIEHIGGDAYRLTETGKAMHRAREDAHRATVIARTGTWQPR